MLLTTNVENTEEETKIWKHVSEKTKNLIEKQPMLFTSKLLKEELFNEIEDKNMQIGTIGFLKNIDIFSLLEFNRRKTNKMLARINQRIKMNPEKWKADRICKGVYSTKFLTFTEYKELLTSRYMAEERFINIYTKLYNQVTELFKNLDKLEEYEKKLENLKKQILTNITFIKEQIPDYKTNLNSLLNLIELSLTNGEDNNIVTLDTEKNRIIISLFREINNLANNYKKVKQDYDTLDRKVLMQLKSLKINNMNILYLFTKTYEKIIERKNQKN